MTDFIDNLLTSMSSKFNEQKEVGPINLNEDKTLKWRGLHNNQYAAVKKRKDGRKTTANVVVDTPENTLVTGENSGSSSTEKIAGNEPLEESVGDGAENSDETRPNRRILRRKMHEEVTEEAGKRASRAKKRQSSSDVSLNAPAVPEKVEKPNEEVIIAETKAAGKRRGRGRKIPNTNDQLLQTDSTITSVDRSKSPNVKAEESPPAPPVAMDISEPQTSEQRRLRRSERTLQGSISVEVKENSDSIVEAKQEIASDPPAIPAEVVSTCDSLKKYRKKSPVERKSTAVDAMDIVDLDQFIPKPSQEEAVTSVNQTEPDGLIKNEEEANGISPGIAASAITEVDAQPILLSKDEKSAVDAEPPLAHTPKKRGRKPGTKLSPKIDVKADLQIATRSSRVKKSPRLNSDESSFTYTLSKKEKTLNEQVISTKQNIFFIV